MPDLTALGNQIIAYEITLTAILQVLAYADSAIGRAIAQASFFGVQERVDEYIGLIESQIAQRPQH